VGENAYSLSGEIWPGPAMKLAGPLAARSPGLRLALDHEIERHCGADEILQAASSTLSSSWMSMARLTFPSRLELNRRAGSFNAAPLANVILTAFLYVSPVQTMPPCEKVESPPLTLFDDLRVCLVYDFAHFRERLPAPVPKFLDLLVD